MRRLLLATTLLLGGHDALAQLQVAPPPPPPIVLKVTPDQAKLIAQTLGAIGCQNVSQLMVCQEAIELLREIQRQAKEQLK